MKTGNDTLSLFYHNVERAAEHICGMAALWRTLHFLNVPFDTQQFSNTMLEKGMSAARMPHTCRLRPLA